LQTIIPTSGLFFEECRSSNIPTPNDDDDDNGHEENEDDDDIDDDIDDDNNNYDMDDGINHNDT
jgi:hypothetical protein